MNHQLIDLWLHDPRGLSAEQTSELNAHLQSCRECRRVYTSWQASARLIETAGQMKAPQGFAARFRASLPERRRKKQLHQVRLFMLVLIGAILAASILFLLRFFGDHPPVQVLSQGIHFFTTAPGRLLEFRYIFSFWLGEVPPVYLICAAIILSGWTIILLVSWVLALMRITHQGVTHEN
jgi:hypothetical protein